MALLVSCSGPGEAEKMKKMTTDDEDDAVGGTDGAMARYHQSSKFTTIYDGA